MRVSIIKDPLFVDVTCDKKDDGVEIQSRPNGKKVLYVSINGGVGTILRICEIQEMESGKGLVYERGDFAEV